MTQRLDTQNARILAHLQRGKTITPIDALKIAGSWRLSGRILELRQAGHPIITEWEQRGGKRYARYRLKRKRAA